MGNNNTSKHSISFSLNNTTKPRIAIHQVRIDGTERNTHISFPKPKHKLVVGRSGKIGYSK